MKKNIFTLMLVAILAASMVACGGSGTSTETTTGAAAQAGSEAGSEAEAVATSTDGKELVVQLGPDPETVDPALNSSVDGGNMILHAFECLLIVGQDGNLQPGQAESWETSEDGLTWTFHLREGLKWSDGTDLTANDFVYSWKRVCDPLVAAPYAETVLGMVEGYEAAIAGDLDALGVTATDDLTLVVQLATPCPYFGSLAAFATLSPVQQATVEANGDAWAIEPSTYVSNGPFYMTEWVPGSHITWSKNPYYRDADSVKLGSLKCLLMEDSNA